MANPQKDGGTAEQRLAAKQWIELNHDQGTAGELQARLKEQFGYEWTLNTVTGWITSARKRVSKKKLSQESSVHEQTVSISFQLANRIATEGRSLDPRDLGHLVKSYVDVARLRVELENPEDDKESAGKKRSEESFRRSLLEQLSNYESPSSAPSN